MRLMTMYVSKRVIGLLVSAILSISVISTASATLAQGQFIPEQATTFGVGVNGNLGTLTIDGDQYPLPALLNPVSSTTIALSPGGNLVVSHRTPQITDTCSGQAVQHMYHAVPANPGEVLPLVQVVCLNQARAFQGLYEQPGLSTQRVAVVREVAAPTSQDQRLHFVRLDAVPGNEVSQLFAADVESVAFAPSGNIALVKYDLPGGSLDPADYRFVDLCPASFGQTVGNYPDVGAGAVAAVELDGNGGFQVRFSHPSFNGGSTVFAIVDCLGDSPPPPTGDQRLVVTLSGNGSGSVVSAPAGISCPNGACQATYAQGTTVSLSATPDLGFTFDGFSGDCVSDQSTVDVLLDIDRTCQANFSRPGADLTVSCMAPSETVAGDIWLQQYTVMNNGPDDTVITTLSLSGLDNLSLNPFASSNSCAEIVGDTTAFCSLGGLLVGESISVDVAFDVNPLARTALSANADATAQQFDPDQGNSQCVLGSAIEVEVELSLTKTATPDPVGVGDVVVYTMEVLNQGRSAATNVVVTDVLPPQVTQVLPATTGSCNVGPVFSSSPTASLVVARVNEGVAPGTTITNTASVSADEAESNLMDNTSSVVVTTAPASANPLGFVELERELSNGFFDFSVPAQSGPFTAYFGDDGNLGVYLNVGGQRVEAFGSQRSVQGRDGTFINTLLSQWPTLDGFNAAFGGQYSATEGIQNLLAQSGACTTQELLTNETPIPNGTLLPDLPQLHDFQLRNNRLAFTSNANSSPLVAIREPGGSFVRIADNTTVLPGAPGSAAMEAIGGMAFNGSEIAFHAGADNGSSVCRNDGQGCTYQGIFLGDSNGIELVADISTPVPGGSGTFDGFLWTAGQMSMDSNSLVFIGRDSQQRYGIYRYNNGSLIEVVGPTTPIPGLAETFDDLGISIFGATASVFSPPSVNGNAVVFWGASAADQRQGLYLWQAGTITTIVRQNDLINGDRVDVLRIGTESLGVDTLAFYASVAEGQSAGSFGAIFTVGVNTDLIFTSGFE